MCFVHMYRYQTHEFSPAHLDILTIHHACLAKKQVHKVVILLTSHQNCFH
jgi:hypothetical protein